MSTDLERLKNIMMSEGIDVSGAEFVRAFRKFENPAGCEHCGARTKVGVVVPAKGKTPEYIKLACCGKKVS